jgi:hypothetical protein
LAGNRIRKKVKKKSHRKSTNFSLHKMATHYAAATSIAFYESAAHVRAVPDAILNTCLHF